MENILNAIGFVKEKKFKATSGPSSTDHAIVDGKYRDIFTSPPDDDHDHVYEPIYIRRKCSAFECMMNQVDRMDLGLVRLWAPRLREQITAAREDSNLVEPLHIQFVGKPRQCKTQMALRILDVLGRFGYLCVSRTSEDAFFDDLQKAINLALHEKRGERFILHPEIEDAEKRREACKLDVVFLDELYSKKKEAADVSTILNGITPMPWRPIMADPKNKGTPHKPFIWLTTANHEVTDHKYSVTALLKRVHLRYVVEGGKFYEQKCHQILEPEDNFLGGFSTCQGQFGRWRRRETSRSVTFVRDPVTGAVREQVTESSSSKYSEEVVDSSTLSTFLCSHSRAITYEGLIAEIMEKATEKLKMSVTARENFRSKIEDACQMTEK